MDFAKIFAEFTPGAYGIWGIFVLVAGFIGKEWRETRKLSLEDRMARRDGYAKQVENLQKENRDLRADMTAAETRHDEYRRLCHAETDALRQNIIRLEGEVAGFKRRIDMQGMELARMKGIEPPPMLSIPDCPEG